MDELKQSVQNATYEQKDPLLIYKFESFELFKKMIDKVNRSVVSTLVKGHLPIQDPDQVREAQQRRKTDYSKYQTSRSDGSGDTRETQKHNLYVLRKKLEEMILVHVVAVKNIKTAMGKMNNCKF
jgi:preprotein translocase subunit SecA